MGANSGNPSLIIEAMTLAYLADFKYQLPSKKKFKGLQI